MEVEAAVHGNKFLEYFFAFMVQDWFAFWPITICSILTVAVVIERSLYYARNKRDVTIFIQRLQRELERSNLEGAQALSNQLGGVVGEVAEEGVRLIAVEKEDFSRAFDITANIVGRKLEKYLAILGTIGATAPFIGLFGTVVGVIVTLQVLGEAGGQTQEVVIGIAKALIATGYGLIVAIIAVIMNNYYTNIVRRFEEDFQLLKLLFLSFTSATFSKPQSGSQQFYRR
ncbi:MAG: MotA/TolQ/ExbB proton channel family protein [Candidatus Melainabacteria bacterium]|nr:MotA/TolQ/ExbB proton channel family protein [Candidatus Melainabacteria bacterium]